MGTTKQTLTCKRAKVLKLLLLLAALVLIVNSQNCPSQSIRFDTSCYDNDKKTPYCWNTDDTNNQATCLECISDCDCKPGRYCSFQPGDNLGTCVKFEAQGKD